MSKDKDSLTKDDAERLPELLRKMGDRQRQWLREATEFKPGELTPEEEQCVKREGLNALNYIPQRKLQKQAESFRTARENARANRDPNSIFSAVEDGDLDKARELLNRKPRLAKAAYHHGWRVLNEAVARGHCDLAELLLARGADVHAKYGRRALLHDALAHRNVVELLLFRGANPNGENEVGDTPLHQAVMFWPGKSAAECKKLVELLLVNGADPNVYDHEGNTPLHRAVLNGSRAAQDIAELLIRYKANINAKDKDGATALHLAAAHGSASFVQVLLASGAYMQARDCSYSTPLHYAAGSGHSAIVDLLLLHGADVTAKDSDGMTAMHWVAIYSKPNLAVLEALLSHGADVNARENRERSTPLHLAAAREKAETELVEFLVNHGSAINATNCYGRTALQIAHNSQNEDIEGLLRRLGEQ